MGKVPSMKRVWTFLEIILSASLLVVGLFMLQEGIANNSTGAVTMVILGAVCITLSVFSLTYAIRSLLWHRYMLKVAKPGPATSQYEHGLREKT